MVKKWVEREKERDREREMGMKGCKDITEVKFQAIDRNNMKKNLSGGLNILKPAANTRYFVLNINVFVFITQKWPYNPVLMGDIWE